jgi:O-antigen/teichoic acid export membrane protein
MLAQKLILSYGSKMFAQFLQIVASIIVARVAGPTVLGTVAFGLAFVSMFSFLADLGIGPAHIKLVSEGRDLGKCISTYAAFKILYTGIFFLVVLAFYLAQKYIFSVKFESPAHEQVILITLLAVTVTQLLYIPNITFAAKTEQAKQDIPELIRMFVYQILRVVLVLLGFRAVALAFGNLVSIVLVIPLIFYMFRGYPRAKFDRDLASKYLKISIPVILIGISTNLIFYLDKVILQYFTNSQQVGYYVAGYRIGGLIFMVGTSAGLIFFPLFSKATSNGDFAYVNRTIDRYERFVYLFIVPLVILVSLYSRSIVSIFLGNEYFPAAAVITLIALAMVFSILNMPYDNLITGMGFFRLAAYVHLANLGFFLVLILTIPNPHIFNLGATGVAWVILLSNLVIGVVLRYFASKRCSQIKVTRNLHFLAFGIVSYGVFHYLHDHLFLHFRGSLSIVFIVIYLFCTYCSLVLLGWMKKEDLDTLRQLVDVGRLRAYIQKEVSSR